MAITSIKTGSSFTNLIKYNDFLGPNAAYDPAAYWLIQRVAGTGSSATITFSSIPSTYKHLQVRVLFRPDTAAPNNLYLMLNGDNGNNYTGHWLRGFSGSAVASGSTGLSKTRPFFPGVYNNAYHNAAIIDILDYANTTKYTTVRTFAGYDDNSDGSVNLSSGLWLNTAAVNEVKITCDAFFLNTSTFALYGITG